MKRFVPILLALLLSACATATPTVLPSATPRPSVTPTATVVWFPPTNTPAPPPTQPPAPTEDLRPGLGDTLLHDEFTDSENWSLATSDQGTAAITNQHLTLTLRQAKSYLATTRKQPYFGDFYAEVTASPQLCSGEDEYGLLLRALSSSDYYRFSLSCDGRAKVERLFKAVPGSMAPWTESGLIPATAPSSVRLGVWASGQEMRFFINDFYLFSITDTVFFQGAIGFFVRSSGDSGVTVTFSDLQVQQVQH